VGIKYFVLFLVYTVIGAITCMVLLIGRGFASEVDLTMLDACFMWFLGIIAVAVIILVSCLLSYHVNLIAKNYTTIEYHGVHYANWNRPHGKEPSHKYDLGLIGNLYSILGPTLSCWLCPVAIPGDGMNFKTIDNMPERL